MSESACTAFSLAENLYGLPLHLFVAGDDHLRYALTVFNDKILTRKVHQDYAYLATVVKE